MLFVKRETNVFTQISAASNEIILLLVDEVAASSESSPRVKIR